MSKKVTLPSGATVTLKDPSTLRVKDRKAIMRASENTTGEVSKAIALGEALISVLVEEWSLDLMPPSVKIESLDELEIADYDAILEAANDISKALFPSLKDNDENKADPESPLDNSKD